MFLMNTLTVPKLKDLVNKPNEQYKDIFATLQKANANGSGASANARASASASASASGANASASSNDTMTNELANFLNELKKPPTNVPTGILASNEMSSDKNGFSAY
jgi:hypothetical protein